jgi:putative tryptophan/tyrosine transport system substrate-binding protein
MRRREFIVGLGGVAAWPVLVNALDAASALRAAEPNRVYRLAACTQLGIAALSTAFWMRFLDRLRQLGYAEGKNLIVDRYAADGQPERYANIARNVVRSAPDAIVIAVSHPLIFQLAKETSTIPIVAVMGDPVALGLVQSIAQPEGNITGIAADAGVEMQGKHLDILREAVPSASRIAYLSPREEWEGAWGHATLEAAHRSGISIIGTPLEDLAEEPQYRQAFETMVQESADALMANGLGPNLIHRNLIAELAERYRLPSICWFPDAVKAHGLLSYGPDYINGDLPDRWAGQVDQILKGAKPRDIPIYQPTKFILVINLRTARAIGLEIPPTLLARADEVIE